MTHVAETPVEEKLKSLYTLQKIDTQIDKLKAVRGELPMEVKDLEDEIAGLETRKENVNAAILEIDDRILQLKNREKEAQKLIKKYEEQHMKVKNNREFEAIAKEIEIEGLEIQAAEKKIKQAGFEKEDKLKNLETLENEIKGRMQDLNTKNAELLTLTEETQIEEDKLVKNREKATKSIDERLLMAYERIRNNYKNGISVAKIERNSCSGCFAQVPPQRQIDIKQRRKVTVCENCGRILVDNSLAEELDAK